MEIKKVKLEDIDIKTKAAINQLLEVNKEIKRQKENKEILEQYLYKVALNQQITSFEKDLTIRVYEMETKDKETIDYDKIIEDYKVDINKYKTITPGKVMNKITWSGEDTK